MKRSLLLAMVMAMALTVTACGDATTAKDGSPPQATWDLVALGDSAVDAPGVRPDEVYVRQYAALLADELNITVSVRTHTTGDLLADWIDIVATDRILRADLAEAEVVTIWLGFHDIGYAVFGGCSGDWPDPLKACFREATASMPAEFDELVGSIMDLVPEEATVLVADIGIPPAVSDRWSGEPFWTEMRRILFERMRDSIHAAAEANGATVVHTYEAGMSHPNPEFVLGDRIHLSPEGHRFLAELHAAQDGLGSQ